MSQDVLTGNVYEVIPSRNLPELEVGDMLIFQPDSPSPREEIVVWAGDYLGLDNQDFDTIDPSTQEITKYGRFRKPTPLSTKTF